jgi:hypothetical protein
VTIATPAQRTIVMKMMDVSIFRLTVMTTMHALMNIAIQNMGANQLLLIVMITINVPKIIVIH